MPGPWLAGLQVRGLDRGETPVADFLCSACLHHERVTGRIEVAEFTQGDPINAHQTNCPTEPPAA